MRIKTAMIILVVSGGVLMANLIIGNRTLDALQLSQVKTACPECHGRVPTYDLALEMHDKHASLSCSRCHGDVSGLKTADNLHTSLEWSGIGIMAFALIGIMTNLLIVNRREKVD